MNDSIGDRMKAQYENRTRFMLPRRTYTVIRVDGKAFHSFTRQMERPFDATFAGVMDATAQALAQAVQGAKIAYVQSDEISVIATDFDEIKTDAWFDGNVQKIVSVAASVATAAFNANAAPAWGNALFDARTFTIPDPIEVENYLIWRQQDATRNSILMVAQAHFSHQAIHGLDVSELQEKLWQEKNVNWNDCEGGFKRGRAFVKSRKWANEVPPIFTQDRCYMAHALRPPVAPSAPTP